MNPKEINWAGYPPQFLKGLIEGIGYHRINQGKEWIPAGCETLVLAGILPILACYEDSGKLSQTESEEILDAAGCTVEQLSEILTGCKVEGVRDVDY